MYRNEIVCVPVVGAAERIGKPRAITADVEDLHVLAELLEECLRRVLTEQWGYELRG